MNHDEVMRLACEEAGLLIVAGRWPRAVLRSKKDEWVVTLTHPMLPAYVAELLVAKIVEHDPGNKRLHAFEAYLHRHARLSISTASAVIRIPAALVALGNLTPEQAQEME